MKEQSVKAYNLDKSCIDWLCVQAKKLDISASKLLNRIIKEKINGKSRN